MSYFITAIVFILIFSALILIHELGHFWMAKRSGIKVEEFGLGLPPRIWGKKKGETIYSINWIPFGGFVRMLGEDSTDKKMLANKRSFVAQSMRNRIKVVVAGVTMNFLLAFVLLSVCFTFGMQPLLMPNDILPKTQEGVIEIEDGILVKSVTVEISDLGIQEGDRLIGFNDEGLTIANIGGVFDTDIKSVKFSNSEKGVYSVPLDSGKKLDDLGLVFESFSAFPILTVENIDENSVYSRAGIIAGDKIKMINGEYIFDIEEFRTKVSGLSEFNLSVLRDDKLFEVTVLSNEKKSVKVLQPMADSPAEKAGFLQNDVILGVNGEDVTTSSFLISKIQSSSEEVSFLVDRDGQLLNLEVLPIVGKVGLQLGDVYTFDNFDGISLFVGNSLYSIVNIKDEKYPFYIAPIVALQESYKLSKLTAEMFVSFIKGFISTASIPEGVSGPVGIAQMTHVFVQEGFIAILRFMALLSLSLAVINILPIPALDGGRLLFILIEFIIGKRINQKMETYVHLAGYLFVLLIILLVTYSDIVKLF